MKTKFGHMDCPDCAHRVAVRINEHETLSYSCDECDGNGYCKKGEGRYASWLKRITRVASPVPEKKPAPEPARKAAGTII